MLVLDANIPIRGVLGKRVPILLAKYEAAVFYAPSMALREAGDHIKGIVPARGGDLDLALRTLDDFQDDAIFLQSEAYEDFETQVRERLARRGSQRLANSRRHSLSNAPYGPKIATSSELALPSGRATVSRYTCVSRHRSYTRLFAKPRPNHPSSITE
jgi:hypothetical protein